MSLPRLLAWCLGGLVVLAAVAVLLARGMARPAYSAAEVAAIEAEWQRVLELAWVPPPPPAEEPVATDFADDLRAFVESGDEAQLAAFAGWLASDGPHRPSRSAGPPAENWTLPLYAVGQHLASDGDPALLTGLLELAHGLRTEAHSIDMLVGMALSMNCLERLAADPDDPALAPVRTAAPAWAPAADEVHRTLARDAEALVQQLQADGLTITSHGGLRPITTVTGDLPREVLDTALRQAALAVLDPGPPPPPPGSWDALATFLFGDPTLIERQLASLIAPARGSLDSSHADLRQRWSEVLGEPAETPNALRHGPLPGR